VATPCARIPALAAVATLSCSGFALAAEPGVAAASPTVPSTTGSPRTVAPSPVEFLTKAAESGLAEVRLAELAQERAESAAVKQFARRMIADHSRANSELESIALSRNRAMPGQLDAAHQGTMDELQGKRGAAFDAAYMAAMHADHRKAIALFESATGPDFQDPQLKNFASRTLPILREHLQMAENIRPTRQASR
jgi:putative membrane protein